MRVKKVRCRPRPSPLPATKSKEGTKWFRHSPSGWAARDELKWELYRTQSTQCAKCLLPAQLNELKFENETWSDDSPPRLIHRDGKKCL